MDKKIEPSNVSILLLPTLNFGGAGGDILQRALPGFVFFVHLPSRLRFFSRIGCVVSRNVYATFHLCPTAPGRPPESPARLPESPGGTQESLGDP